MQIIQLPLDDGSSDIAPIELQLFTLLHRDLHCVTFICRIQLAPRDRRVQSETFRVPQELALTLVIIVSPAAVGLVGHPDLKGSPVLVRLLVGLLR